MTVQSISGELDIGSAKTTETNPVPNIDYEDIEPPKVKKSHLWAVRLASIVFTVGSWEILGRQVDPLFMSYPSAIAAAAVRLTASGELISATYSSLRIVAISFGLATIIGLALGLLIGRYRYVEAAADWLVNALYCTPKVAIVPLVIIWFGLGDSAKIFIVTLLTVFPILINAIAGVKNVPRNLIDVGAAFDATEPEIFRKIILPSALPYMMTGLRLGIGRGLIGMVVAEFYTAINGLGAMIVKYGNQYDTASMFVPILVLMLLGVTLTIALRSLDKYFAPWRYVDD
ncbi:ABC transporter permease [Shinella lacus]|uniref:ABC transporter permease n=1 Tax=Shinella lacus TaxID=2654216 RepID=A0ABT1R5L6_9HYPH|nr:ABC transporter permease [Shinella lacus]MCQ4630478.1 ABC transporter permease [Shinella lacus]